MGFVTVAMVTVAIYLIVKSSGLLNKSGERISGFHKTDACSLL